ncbi:MAG: hypothetical protein ABJB55_07435 [Actinomycetota bacterium]
MAIAIGSQAPPVPGVAGDAPRVLVFFKVTCSTTQLATPAIELLARAYPGRVTGVGQDAAPALDGFASDHALTLPLVADLDPFTASDAYGIVSAPTAIAVGADGAVLDVAESWDRAAWNRLSAAFAAEVGAEPAVVSEPGDGLPEFKPG